MKNRFILGILIISLQLIPTMHGFESLNQYRWKFRIIAYDTETINLDTLKTKIAEYDDQIAERDIRFIALNMTVDSELPHHLPALSPRANEALSHRLDINPSKTKLILIGKDGGLKARIDSIDFPAVFQKIDQMPMRRAEMEN